LTTWTVLAEETGIHFPAEQKTWLHLRPSPPTTCTLCACVRVCCGVFCGSGTSDSRQSTAVKYGAGKLQKQNTGFGKMLYLILFLCSVTMN